MKLCIISSIFVVIAVLGCSGSDTSSQGGSGGEATTTSAPTGGGGSGGQTETTSSNSTTETGGAGGVCDVPGESPCAAVPAGYPNPLLGYDPDSMFEGALYAAPSESPHGAAIALLGPFADDTPIAGVSVVFGVGPVSGGACAVPDTVRVAVWSEPQCGLPSESPEAHAWDVPTANLTSELLNEHAYRYRFDRPDTFIAPAGEGTFVALILTTTDTCVSDWVSNAQGARAAWLGWVDNDCDGEVDKDANGAPMLGAAYLNRPTAPGIDAFPYDLGLGVY